MFHIPKDKRALRSTEMICEGLSKCLQSRPFSELSVTDICAAAQVGRTTFYRLFDNPADVLTYQYENALTQILQRQQDSHASLSQVMLELVTENRTLTGLIVHSGRMDILAQVHRKYYQTLIEWLPAKVEIEPQEAEYVISVLSLFIVGIVTTWEQSEQKPDPDELHRYLKKIYQLLGYLL